MATSPTQFGPPTQPDENCYFSIPADPIDAEYNVVYHKGLFGALLKKMGYKLQIESKTSGPINAIFFDREHGTMWGGSSDYGEDYGVAW